MIALVDVNNQQSDGNSNHVLGFEPLADKWQAFGWHVQRVDGNDLAAVFAAFNAARSYAGDKPRVILFDTLMGKGVPFLEQREKNHFIRVDEAEWQQAIAILDEAQSNRSEEHTSELQSIMRTTYAVIWCKIIKYKRQKQHTKIMES